MSDTVERFELKKRGSEVTSRSMNCGIENCSSGDASSISARTSPLRRSWNSSISHMWLSKLM